MLDEWGYSELVMHPPPLNFFTIFLIPCVIRKGLMKRMAELFGKLMFWLENLLYFIIMFIYEMILVPFIFFRVCFHIIRLSTISSMVFLLLVWVFTGIFFLLFNVYKDMFYYLKIMCDYKDENDIY
jgi:hypothetical protein